VNENVKVIRSSVLGGRVLAEFKDLTTYAENDPLKYSSKSYVYLKGVQLGFQMDAHKTTGDKHVVWMYHNPTVGNYFAEYQLNNSSYQQLNFPNGEMTFDPIGSFVGLSESQPIDIPSPFTFVMGQFMEPSTGKCYADYVETRCEVVQQMLNNGTGAHAPLDPYTTDSNNRLNRITFDWDNGFYGFVPVGARRSQSGKSWYDPYTQTEGTLRNKLLSFNFGAGFGLTGGQQGQSGEPPSSLRRPYPCLTIDGFLASEDLQVAMYTAWSKTLNSKNEYGKKNEFGGFILWDRDKREATVYLSNVEGKPEKGTEIATWDVYEASLPIRSQKDKYGIIGVFHTHPPGGGVTRSQYDRNYITEKGIPFGIIISGYGKYSIYGNDVSQKELSPEERKKCLPFPFPVLRWW